MARKHQLMVIMFTDIVGYTRLMAANESMTMSLLEKNRSIHRKWIRKFNGNWLKEMGDGALASFSSITSAVYCAGAILSECQHVDQLQLRIGIHLGDVLSEGKEIYGDGVNIASRIETKAEVNKIAVTEPIYQNIRNKDGVILQYAGSYEVKNVDDPVKVYTVEFKEDIVFEELVIYSSKTRGLGSVILMLILLLAAFVYFQLIYNKEGVPTGHDPAGRNIESVAVLPFTNLTGDSAQEYMIAGLHDNLITSLSQVNSLEVISKTSTLRYKQPLEKSIQDIARELNVDAIIEASILQSEDSVRINIQLIEAFPEENHIWADVFDHSLGNIFFLLDDLTSSIVEEISRTLVNPKNKAKKADPEAFRAYMLGKFYSETVLSSDNLRKASQYFERSIELDSTFAPAYAGISWIWIVRFQMGLTTGAQAIPKIYAYNQKAPKLLCFLNRNINIPWPTLQCDFFLFLIKSYETIA